MVRALASLCFATLLLSCSTTTGGDAGTDGGVDLGSLDMSADVPILSHCVGPADCDDHLFCTGVEACQPGNPAADMHGCVRGLPPCEAGFDCSETTHGCTLPDGGSADGGAPDLGPPVDLGPPDLGPPFDAGPPGDVRSTIYYVDLDTGAVTRLPVPTTASGGTPDTSCFGTAGAPSSTGTATPVSLDLADFQTSAPAPSLTVDWYTDDVLPASLACGTCTTTTSGVSGGVTVTTIAGSWIAYDVHPHMGADMAHSYVTTVGEHLAATGGAAFYAVSQQTLALIPTLLGLHRVAGSSVLFGIATDCAGEPVVGLVLRAFRPDGTLIVEPPDGTPGAASMPAYRYDGTTGLPSASQYYTNTDGIAWAANVPAGAPVRLEAWEDDGTTVHLWACEEIVAPADGTGIVPLRPYRSDGPTTCTETRP